MQQVRRCSAPRNPCERTGRQVEACTISCCLISYAFAPGARVENAACGGRFWHTPVEAAAATARTFCCRIAGAAAAPVGSTDEEEGWDTQVTCAPAFVTVDQSNPHYSSFSIDVRAAHRLLCGVAPRPPPVPGWTTTLHVLPAADRGLALVRAVRCYFELSLLGLPFCWWCAG